MKVFVDTNILIDYVCRRAPFFLPAKAIFASGYLGKSQIAVSALSIVNSIYIGRKYGSETLKIVCIVQFNRSGRYICHICFTDLKY